MRRLRPNAPCHAHCVLGNRADAVVLRRMRPNVQGRAYAYEARVTCHSTTEPLQAGERICRECFAPFKVAHRDQRECGTCCVITFRGELCPCKHCRANRIEDANVREEFEQS